MDRAELMQLFNNPARMGTLSTSDGAGNLNSGVFSALQMVDDDTVLLACGDNRSLSNLARHPKAVFCFFEPAASPYDWKGARVYLDVAKIERTGATFEHLVAVVRQKAGGQAADNVRAAVTFTIGHARPLIDMGA